MLNPSFYPQRDRKIVVSDKEVRNGIFCSSSWWIDQLQALERLSVLLNGRLNTFNNNISAAKIRSELPIDVEVRWIEPIDEREIYWFRSHSCHLNLFRGWSLRFNVVILIIISNLTREMNVSEERRRICNICHFRCQIRSKWTDGSIYACENGCEKVYLLNYWWALCGGNLIILPSFWSHSSFLPSLWKL